MHLLCDIDKGGFIRSLYEVDSVFGTRKMVHKETIGMHDWAGCFGTLAEAKEAWQALNREDAIVLTISDDGVGRGLAIWASKEQLPIVHERLQVWKGCYGAWPVKLFNNTGTELMPWI